MRRTRSEALAGTITRSTARPFPLRRAGGGAGRFFAVVAPGWAAPRQRGASRHTTEQTKRRMETPSYAERGSPHLGLALALGRMPGQDSVSLLSFSEDQVDPAAVLRDFCPMP